MFAQALRMSWRDWRAGELRFLVLALIVAVAALSAVNFFVDRLRNGLERDAHQLLGADLVIGADLPIAQSWRDEARRRGLQLAETVIFPSMAQQNDQVTLAAVKAVSSGYPLRGNLRVSARSGDLDGQPTREVPAPGTVWVDANLLTTLHTDLGATLRLGERSFRIARLIALEPDKGSSFVNLAPRVMLALDDLEATGLSGNGARLGYFLQVAGPDMGAVAGFERWVRAEISQRNLKGVRVESLENGRPEMRATLERANRFLSLVGLLSAMLAAVAVAMAARRFMLRHLDACAMLRCLGLTQNQVSLMYLIEFLLVGLAGSLLGVALGFGAHYVLIELVGSLVVDSGLPPAGWLPAVQGVATGLLLLLGFALPPILQLRNVPHNRVIRREAVPPQPAAVLTYGLGLAAFGALLWWQSGDPQIALYTGVGFVAALALFALVAWLGLRLLRALRGSLTHQGWRFALNGLQRRPGATVLQVVSLALGLMALLLLTVVRSDLISAWRASTPPDAPNRFIINIQPDQTASLQARLRTLGVPEATLYPMIRGRLLAINDKPITATTYASEDARRMADREFNLSTMKDMQSTNQIVAGRWYVDGPGVAEASVEQGIARTLGIRIGDALRWNIGGQIVDVKVTSLRKLEWGSMRANFFVIINPAAMANTAQTFMTAFHLAPAAGQGVAALTRDYPNLTVFDVSAIVKQLQDVLDQVIAAVEFLFAFTLASGLLVLYAALMGSQEERMREAALLRALGATRRLLAQAQWIEFLLVGALAGALAASGAAVMGWALATYQFKFAWSFSPLVWLAGLGAGALCAAVGGWFGLRRVLTQPPLQTLREA
ncbi:ABC transporter permease [Massilia sp. TS11]|uniref:ABC transporter permease n=1 Tax=Massilia sp. TS11 TaxID=2908003 RepID=UPI001EDBF9D5|nr:FtsX-like permease family protein [Massilia sp. TS11]MCG2582804.1 FtsX-like permease family protein [Massilia sp. TS11]